MQISVCGYAAALRCLLLNHPTDTDLNAALAVLDDMASLSPSVVPRPDLCVTLAEVVPEFNVADTLDCAQISGCRLLPSGVIWHRVETLPLSSLGVFLSAVMVVLVIVFVFGRLLQFFSLTHFLTDPVFAASRLSFI